MQIFVKRVFLSSVLIFFIALAQPLWAQSRDIAPESTKKNEPGIPLESDTPPPSLFERRMIFEKLSEHNPFVILPHKPTYLLPLTYNTSADGSTFKSVTGDDIQRAEIKFQLSLKILMAQNLFKENGQLAFAYTQQSNWQAYQFEQSSPFRETNHEAELMLSFFNDTHISGFRNQMNTLGLIHHSNGRTGKFSRSWNRIYVNFIFEKSNFLVSIKPWFRIPDKTKRDENPDIEKFYGYGEILAHYRMGDYTFGFVLRNNMRKKNKGAIQVDWTFPFYGKINGYFQYFNGYGESLIDYQDSTNRFGLGIILTNWL
ncbi:Phospholipase A1 @ Outer membrane phospholipase A [hydrothermal vent metagenome]|uniref:Phosphatidylcholine 1-acylhydrolase n=1 Tax=hydrothermal vent metagenome TaxID=652676 RepID=A0A3B1DHC2_9ZZZZ